VEELPDHRQAGSALVSPVLKISDQEVLDRVREYLVTADLAYSDREDMAEAVGVEYATVQYRLGKLGTSWGEEKRAERVTRLKSILAAGGRINVEAGMEEVGFTEPVSFLRLFRSVTGKTLTEYRRDQADSVKLSNFYFSHETTGVRI